MATLWMVRCEGGSLYESFRDRSVVAIGWHELADATKGMERETLVRRLREQRPECKDATIVIGASQVWRFINEVAIDDEVVTYDPRSRRYLFGVVRSDARKDATAAEAGMPIVRDVTWLGEVDRDALSVAAKASLGPTLTLFRPAEVARTELVRLLEGAGCDATPCEATHEAGLESAAEVAELLEDNETRALEFVKDRVMALDWSELQDLVAGILRAMGYKTRVARAGSDRGADVIASPDGLGFETPRIVVEVKHRKAQTDSATVRSLLGGRHKDDGELFVSTGGFSKDARYQADRAGIPVMLWGLDELVGSLIDYYEQLDSDARQLAPLKRVYWPP